MCPLPSLPLPSLDIVCCVLCVFVWVCRIVYVLGEGGGGTCVYAFVKYVGCYECICHAPPPPDASGLLFFVLYLFYPSRLERFVF